MIAMDSHPIQCIVSVVGTGDWFDIFEVQLPRELVSRSDILSNIVSMACGSPMWGHQQLCRRLDSPSEAPSQAPASCWYESAIPSSQGTSKP